MTLESLRSETRTEIEREQAHYDKTFISFCDVDKTFVARGATAEEIKTHVEIYRQTLIQLCKEVHKKEGKKIKIRTVFLTTRPPGVFTDLNDPLHELLSITDITADSDQSEHVDLHATFLCEQGTVILAPIEAMGDKIHDDTFKNHVSGYGSYIVDKYKEYSQGSREILIQSISEAGILSDIYEFEKDTRVNVSITRKDKQEMSEEEKDELWLQVLEAINAENRNVLKAIKEDKSGHDLDIFPKLIADVRKKEAIDSIMNIVNDEKLFAYGISLFLADDSVDAVDALLPPFKRVPGIKSVQALVVANADPELIQSANNIDMEFVYSTYPYFYGYLCSLYHAIAERKLAIRHLEVDKLRGVSKSSPRIICIGEYAQLAVDQVEKRNYILCEKSIVRLANSEEALIILQGELKNDPTPDKTKFKQIIAGMKMVISVRDRSRDEKYFKELIEFLSSVHEQDCTPIPIICINLTKNRRALSYSKAASITQPSTRAGRVLTRKVRVAKDEPVYAFFKINVPAGSTNPNSDIHYTEHDLRISSLVELVDEPLPEYIKLKYI